MISVLEINPAPSEKRHLQVIKLKLDEAKTFPSPLRLAHEVLRDLVAHHCSMRDEPPLLADMDVEANEDALDYLLIIGWLEKLPGEVKRWIWTEKAYKPDF